MQCFCAGSAPFSHQRGTALARSTHSASHVSSHVLPKRWDSSTPQPWMLGALLTPQFWLRAVHGSCQLVSLSALSAFFQNNCLASLCTAVPGAIYGVIHELYTITMPVMERGRAVGSSASLQRPLSLNPWFTLSYIFGMGARILGNSSSLKEWLSFGTRSPGKWWSHHAWKCSENK